MATSTSTLRVALIGTGRVGRIRARELNLRNDVRLVAVASHSLTRAQELAAPYQAEATTDWETLVKRPDVDVVMVCTLNQQHAPICEAALQARKHTSVDYPVALSLAETQRLIDLARSQSVVFHVEHIELLAPWFQALVNNLPKVGQPLAVLWGDLSARKPSLDDWTFNVRSGFSLFAGASVLSRLIRLAGPAQWIDASENLVGTTDDGFFQSRFTTAHIGFANGVIGQIADAVGLAVTGVSHALTIIGTQGMLVAKNRQQVKLAIGTEVIDILPMAHHLSHFAQDVTSFVEAIRFGKPTYVSLDHVLQVMRLADAAERSCREGKRIVLN
ncbi:MAG TPA: Gfo/Idh/MocA family oxidoreductase [Acidobacteriota bacterium]|nr:Gfo/Idh/MocA family oxidoreductase [Acidobacteriota bacterium]HND20388.1 Gfo/Idh/MocA family oxidoreductase [Acidobacteriota bacterium]HNH84827.1 Gfo/Idh/MocA family oxidoreductase [Acidobacteriota bacterium]HNJ41909.1 Gfo/Idh/MocA family oxidoreductase [Acidobacteriota bacterium]